MGKTEDNLLMAASLLQNQAEEPDVSRGDEENRDEDGPNDPNLSPQASGIAKSKDPMEVIQYIRNWILMKT